MSRFATLRKHLPLKDALSVYLKLKSTGGKDLQIPGFKAPFSLRNNPFDYATFEEVILREEYNIRTDVSPKTIIDAGANIGLTSIYFANKFPDSLIVSLEPDEQNFKLLKDNVNAYPNVKPVLGGLWKKPAFLTIEDAKAGNNAFTVKEVEADGPEVVKAFSVDGIMDMMGWATVDLLKIDIEGSEKEVFGTGNLPWLPKVKVLIIELHDRMVPGCSRSVFNAIVSADFSMEVKGENLVFTNNALLQS